MVWSPPVARRTNRRCWTSVTSIGAALIDRTAIPTSARLTVISASATSSARSSLVGEDPNCLATLCPFTDRALVAREHTCGSAYSLEGWVHVSGAARHVVGSHRARLRGVDSSPAWDGVAGTGGPVPR